MAEPSSLAKESLSNKIVKDLEQFRGSSLTTNSKVYLPQMGECLREMARVLKSGGPCVLVLGDVEREGKMRRTAEVLGDLATEITSGQFKVETIYDDRIPDERRSRRHTRTATFERILVMRKI